MLIYDNVLYSNFAITDKAVVQYMAMYAFNNDILDILFRHINEGGI